MPEYLTPGVYVEEVPSGARPIQAVGTRTAGFVGIAPNADKYDIDKNKAVAINNWAEFTRRFISPPPEVFKKASDDDAVLKKHRTKFGEQDDQLTDVTEKANRKLLNDNAKASREETEQKFPPTHLSHAVYGFFLNGGSRCYVVNIGANGTAITSGASGGSPEGLDVLEQIDEVAIVAAPGYITKEAYEAVRTHCEKLKDRVGILDGPKVMDDKAMLQLSGEPVQGLNDSDWHFPPNKSAHGHVTLYVPWLKVSNPNYSPQSSGSNGNQEKTILVPPSGHIAGVWARSDATRGVHKAPANEIVNGALGLDKQVTHEEQGMLNDKGVNVIRQFPNKGFLVWGARTLTDDSSFKYLNVRRLFNMIEESIEESTRWIVFEPNDRPLWQAIRRDVTAFLMGFWRDGALMGKTPEEAFYVKCDEETNPIESRREGKVIIEVGLAPVYPAEFVIFRISQYEAGTEVQVQS